MFCYQVMKLMKKYLINEEILTEECQPLTYSHSR